MQFSFALIVRTLLKVVVDDGKSGAASVDATFRVALDVVVEDEGSDGVIDERLSIAFTRYERRMAELLHHGVLNASAS